MVASVLLNFITRAARIVLHSRGIQLARWPPLGTASCR